MKTRYKKTERYFVIFTNKTLKASLKSHWSLLKILGVCLRGNECNAYSYKNVHRCKSVVL
jgi:hypothetical protein